MTCRQAQKRLTELWDAGAHASQTAEVRLHLAECPECAREFAELQAVLDLIEPPVTIQASSDFKERVMNEAMKTEAPAPRGWRIAMPRLAFSAAVAAALVIAAPFVTPLFNRHAGGSGPVASLLAQSVQAMSNLDTFHISARMRTRPQENFEFIDPAADFVPIEIYRQAGTPGKWRVEKSKRVAVMDGTSALQLINNQTAVRGTVRANFLDWLAVLLEPDRVLLNEQTMNGRSPSQYLVSQAKGEEVLTVKRSPAGAMANDWVLNKTISTSHHTRTYRFAADTKRLTGMTIALNLPTGDVTVFEITNVEYNKPLDPALFTLQLPANVSMYVPPEQMPSALPLPADATSAARMFFDGLSRENWDEVLAVYPESTISDSIKQGYGGLTLISLGEPFHVGAPLNKTWVPYEIQFKSGGVKKFNLCLRNDNKAGRWVVDGGF